MSPLSGIIVSIFSTMTLAGQAVFIGLLVVLMVYKYNPEQKYMKKTVKFISENYLSAVLIVSAVATVGSLSFSEIASFTPCKLCWFQRIAMYPIALISFVALLKNDLGAKKYIVPLAVIGAVVSGYHILVQTFPQALECSDEVAKCSAVEFAQFGFITIPVMAFTSFLLIILLGLFSSKK